MIRHRPRESRRVGAGRGAPLDPAYRSPAFERDSLPGLFFAGHRRSVGVAC